MGLSNEINRLQEKINRIAPKVSPPELKMNIYQSGDEIPDASISASCSFKSSKPWNDSVAPEEIFSYSLISSKASALSLEKNCNPPPSPRLSIKLLI